MNKDDQKRLFGRVLYESRGSPKDSFVYDRESQNQNTLQAWIRRDITEWEGNRVRIDDGYGSFNWDPMKSNKNLPDDQTPLRKLIEEGKGFSFYFARYALCDKFSYDDESLSSGDESDEEGLPISNNIGKSKRTGVLSSIRFKFILENKEVKNHPVFKGKLNPDNYVLLVINKPNDNSIISARFSNEDDHIKVYSENAARRAIETLIAQEHPIHHHHLREKVQPISIRLIQERIKNGYDEFKDFLISLHKEL